MGGLRRPRAVLLDALGTLLWLEPPAPALRAQLLARHGIDVGENAAERAMAAEMAYYRAHVLEGHDRTALGELRTRCASVLLEALGPEAAGLDAGEAREALLAALRFRPYPDVHGALEHLRGAGMRLVVVSNWDVSLHDRLAQTGIAERVDGAVASAEVGAAKPDPAVFARALVIAGVPAGAAVHVGDSLHEDVEGARAAGIEPILLRRAGDPHGGVRTIASLRELPGAAS
jgi:putative hydrolase of the HAD superfamily